MGAPEDLHHPSDLAHGEREVDSEMESSSAPLDVNVSGHKQELKRHFSLLDICAVGITTGNTWVALGGSIAVSIYNGGPPGVLYEFIAVSVFYWLIAASIAELASAMPSSSGVYHWAFSTSGRFGRPVAFFAGNWNFLAWIFASASMSAILGNQTVSMYTLFNPDFSIETWHVFVSYLCCTWLCCFTVLFCNQILPKISSIGGFLIISGVFITILICAIMPSTTGSGYASTSAVWTDWTNQTGYTSQGFVFILGMLNGAYAVGTADCVTHLAEEIPNPTRLVPIAIFAQVAIGFGTGLVYLITLFYAAPQMPSILTDTNATFPLVGLYRQATNSRGGAMGLLLLAFFPTFITCIGCYVTAGRTLWTLARDRAVPGSRYFSQVSQRWGNPFYATLLCGFLNTLLGCIYVGSTTAFNAFVGSFVVLVTMSYSAAILPHMLTGRNSVIPGWFWMKGWMGWIVNGVSVSYMLVFIVVFCFPYSVPFNAASMNYSCLIAGGWTLFVAIFWTFRRKSYNGPPILSHGQPQAEEVLKA